LVTIHDSGPGISAEHLPHLFERFYRAEGDRGRYIEKNGQSIAGGAGLGLAIAAEIVKMHSGHLQVESQPGEGTTFMVRLPSS
jgi:signal transduction histidine kinase